MMEGMETGIPIPDEGILDDKSGFSIRWILQKCSGFPSDAWKRFSVRYVFIFRIEAISSDSTGSGHHMVNGNKVQKQLKTFHCLQKLKRLSQL